MGDPHTQNPLQNGPFAVLHAKNAQNEKPDPLSSGDIDQIAPTHIDLM